MQELLNFKTYRDPEGVELYKDGFSEPIMSILKRCKPTNMNTVKACLENNGYYQRVRVLVKPEPMNTTKMYFKIKLVWSNCEYRWPSSGYIDIKNNYKIVMANHDLERTVILKNEGKPRFIEDLMLDLSTEYWGHKRGRLFSPDIHLWTNRLIGSGLMRVIKRFTDDDLYEIVSIKSRDESLEILHNVIKNQVD